jgi:hypothetical protein
VWHGRAVPDAHGDDYRRHALTILTEALARYEAVGLFVNTFGDPSADYSGVPAGPCACDACRTRRSSYPER